MKSIIFTFLCICLFFNKVNGQFTPPELIFDGIQPEWTYLSEDTTFIQSPEDPFSSPFWGRHIVDFLSDDDYLYLLELVISQTPYGGLEGCLLHKLDVSTGKPEWIYHSTSYVGNKYREYYQSGSMSWYGDNMIRLVGDKSIDTIMANSTGLFNFHTRPVEKIIDVSNGALMSEKYSNLKVEESYNVIPNRSNVMTLGNGDVVHSSYNLSVKNGKKIKAIEVREVDDITLDIDSLKYFRTEHITAIDENDSDAFSPYWRKLNKDTLLVISPVADTSSGWILGDVKLIWLDISKKENVSVIKELNVTNELEHPDGAFNSSVLLFTKDNNIFITQQVEDTLSIITQYYAWLAWYDHDGVKLAKVRKNLNNAGEPYHQHKFIGVLDGVAYVLARHEKTVDILAWHPNDDKMEVLNQIGLENEDVLVRLRIGEPQFLPDNKLFVGLNGTVKNDNDKNSGFNYYYKFDLKDLGIITKTEKIAEDSFFKIMPNPSSGIFKIEFGAAFSGELRIINSVGQSVWDDNVNNEKSIQINLYNQKPGIYFLYGKNIDLEKKFKTRILLVK
ncbi:MAG: T9SS type A sorting domain-containing protein [Saprospiraceae bacterium]